MFGLYWGEDEVLDIYEDGVSKDSIIEDVMIKNSKDFKEIDSGGSFSGFHNVMIFKEESRDFLTNSTRSKIISGEDYSLISLMSYFTEEENQYTSLFLLSLDFMNSEEKTRISCRLNPEIVVALKKLPKKKMTSFIEEKLIDYLLSKVKAGNLIKYFKNKNITFFAGKRLILLNSNSQFKNFEAEKLEVEEINDSLPKRIVDYKLDSVLMKQIKDFSKLNNMSVTEVITEALIKK
ncbi:MAG: hypothetical protein C0625_10480 [Arcobacter sp.]|nr:MAG: hypothetical protein C0625_10480 [Arcobacter sp.]